MSETGADSPFAQVPVEVTIAVGKAHPLVSELLNLAPGSVLKLDRRIEDPVEIYVGDKLFAHGELQEDPEGREGQIVVRLTSFVSDGASKDT